MHRHATGILVGTRRTSEMRKVPLSGRHDGAAKVKSVQIRYPASLLVSIRSRSYTDSESLE